MSKLACHSQLPTSDFDIQNFMDINADNRRQTSLNDKRIHNVNYVRHVLRRFFGSHTKKSSFDETSYEQSPNNRTENLTSPILNQPCLEYDKHAKFTGK
jgi:hypothetical protein